MSSRCTTEDLAYGERWDKDRFDLERERDRSRLHRTPPEPRDYVPRRAASRPPRPWEDPYPPPPPRRERVYYDDDPLPRMQRASPPTGEFERRLVIDDRRERDGPSPSRRPNFLRRQSSLDTFDRRPRFREEYPPPARRSDYRPEPYEPIPLPRARALPPPRMYAERDLEEIKISDPDYYGNDDFYAYPERIREREVIKSRKRDGSESRTSKPARSTRSSHRSSHHTSSHSSSKRSRSTSSSSSSSDSGGTTVTVKSEYPKKGKTRIPERLVSKRAIMDLGYPFTEEGSTIIVQKALGQHNIDDLLKLSEEYKKAEAEVAAARSSAGHVEERREEVFTIPPPPPTAAPAPAPAPSLAPAPAPAPQPAPPAAVIEERTSIRGVSPSRTHHSSHTSRTSRTSRSHSTSTTSRTPVIIDAAPREVSHDVPVGPLSLIHDRRSDREIDYDIARLKAERDLMRRERHHHHHHSHHSHSPGREMVRAERLPTGELVMYEQEVERIEEPRRGVRLEKDKKGPPQGLVRAMLATLT